MPERSARTMGKQAGWPMKKVFRSVDDLEGHTLGLRIAANREALREAIELIVAIEERIHRGVGEDLVGLPEDAARQGEGEEIAPAFVIAHQPAVVEDHGRGNSELVAVSIHPLRHATGGDAEGEASFHGALEPTDELQVEIGRVAEQGPVEVAHEQA